jgi:intracellular multiplication protein IcmB
MFKNMFADLMAGLSLALKQPLCSFCDIETTHGNALVTNRTDYATLVRIDGMRRMSSRKDIERGALAQRVELQSLLENKGHAIVGWYSSDPLQSSVEIERINLSSCRNVAKALNMDFHDILNERAARWPKLMRWEAAYYVLWTRTSALTKVERKNVRQEQDALARQWSKVGESQRFFLRSETMAARHGAFVQRVMGALRNQGIAGEELDAHAALKLARETLYRETSGSEWRATLIGDRVMPRLPDDPDEANPHPGGLLWPSIRDQIFNADAHTKGGRFVEIGDYEYAPVDMMVGPEDPRPFLELAAALGRDRIPWRASIIIEGGGKTAMAFKEGGAGFLHMFPGNGDIRRAFARLRQEREQNNHASVRMRASFATWAPIEEAQKLRRRASILSNRLEGWGNCKATQISGDPLEAAMASVPGLALGSTAAPSLALLGDAIAMMPLNRTASPWSEGSVLFRRPDGSIAPYDPTGGSVRPLVCDIFVSPPGGGKSVLANTINIGLCLSTAVLGGKVAKLPFIGKLDIGNSANGLVELLRNALGPDREHEAIFVTMQTTPGYEINVFDLQVGCEKPLKLERAFLQNFLALLTLPLTGKPFEGMDHLIGFVIDEAYRSCTDVPNGSPKVYNPGVEPLVDAAIRRYRFALPHHAIEPGGMAVADTWWRDVVNLLIGVGEHRLAAVAQRHAVPVMKDLIAAARTEQVRDAFKELKISETTENVCATFERYIYEIINSYETLCKPTRLDFGPARVIVIDLAAVAPTGSDLADRQTEMMYMLGRYILARNWFLHPDYIDQVPLPVQDYHLARFTENVETIKRIDYDEWHRTQGSPQVREQAALDVREGRKHNVQLEFASQRLSDFGESIIAQSTGRFILKTGDEKESEEIIARFNLNETGAHVVRYGLPGPGADGAPFFAIINANATNYEQLLINSLGPVELWSLSTTPSDANLRNRLYVQLGSSETLRRLSKIFPAGSAMTEIDRRKKARIKKGQMDAEAEEGVVDQLASELSNGEGIAIRLRDGSTWANDDDGYAVAAE